MNPNLPPMHRLRVRALPDDMVLRVLDQLVEGTPPEDLCGRLYERCLLLLGSGQCPPDHPVWAQACRRFGVMQKGVGLETWQATFRAFCKEIASLPPNIRAVVWKYVRGDGAAVPFEDWYTLLRFFADPPPSPPPRHPPGAALTLVSRALSHFGALDPIPVDLEEALWSDDWEAVLRLIDGHPRHGEGAILYAIQTSRRRYPATITSLLAAGVPVETMVRDRETLLHHAVSLKKGYAVEQLLQAGADQTARDASGRTPAVLAKNVVLDAFRTESTSYTDDSNVPARELLMQLWPTAAMEWLAMSNAERRDAARDGWSPGRS